MQRKPFNPCSVEEPDVIPAKIWELLRRNRKFIRTVGRLQDLDRRAQNLGPHRFAWPEEIADRMVEAVQKTHAFASIALQWLAPQPLFEIRTVAPEKIALNNSGIVRLRTVKLKVGTTADPKDRKHWKTFKATRDHDAESTANLAGRIMRRRPRIRYQEGRLFGHRVNEIQEWRDYHRDGRCFRLETCWGDAPSPFRRAFGYIWRRQFDSRAVNPLTKTRIDAPHPHESDFFSCEPNILWNSNFPRGEEWLVQAIRAQDLQRNFRIFAIPKTILTKASADAMGEWLSNELKKGSNLFGDLLKGGLLNEGELFGTSTEWADWICKNLETSAKGARHTHFYRRCKYLDSLILEIFPKFYLGSLLARPPHRARGKRYVRKVGQK